MIMRLSKFKIFNLMIIMILARNINVNSQSAITSKCCPVNETLQGDGVDLITNKCEQRNVTFKPTFWPTFINTTENVNLVIGNPCKYLMDEVIYSEFFLLRNGTLYLPIYKEFLNIDQYCLDTLFIENQAIILPIICFPKPKFSHTLEKIVSLIFPYGFLLSSMLLTIAIILEVRFYKKYSSQNNFHSYWLYFHVCLIISFTTLLTRHLISKTKNKIITVLEFTLQYLYVSSLFMLSMMSYEFLKIFSCNNKFNKNIQKYLCNINSISMPIWIFLIQGVISYITNWSSVLPTIFLLYNETESVTLHFLRIFIYEVFYGILLMLIGILTVVTIKKNQNIFEEYQSAQTTNSQYQYIKQILAVSLMVFYWLLEIFGVPSSEGILITWIIFILATVIIYSISLPFLILFYSRKVIFNNTQTEMVS
ncbi:uncharacterized protein LOC126903357 isoform X2 [Daktulosphaira vitifoliae]|uniref:uncharacterized protein LOC126903357 isoform X2 n=1 Tax=Daktulosphaira vitifoliae TaxID=58002 RepID=UPI0021AA2503|nr:uncharacterized protein LOC126903357 isoform X2 [Daktulosphaira vitifoliae]